MASDIVITGYGTVTAAGADAVAGYESIAAGLVNNSPVGSDFFPPPFCAPCFRVREEWLLASGELGGRLEGAPANRTIHLALTAIEEGLRHAGLFLDSFAGKRVGIVMGTTVGCTFHNEEYYRVWSQGKEPDPAPLATYLSANLAARLQSLLSVSGPRAVITNACASATDAIGVAKNWLVNDLCDIAIAGGADELSRIACHGFKSLMLVSAKSCQPFDRERQGLNLGEGAGVFVMEKKGHAVARNAMIRGYVRGYGIGGDAHHPTAPHPEGRGLQYAVSMALADAGVATDKICMINAHGTGTPANDRAETAAIAAAGFTPEKVSVVSTKGATGHTLGAAGGVEAVFALMALNSGTVHGTVGCQQLDSELAFTPLVHGEKVDLVGRIGMSQSLAFGGSNSALVLEAGEG